MRPDPTGGGAREGVVLLHGIARRAASLRPMERRLAGAGYAVLNLDYPARRLDLSAIVERIHPAIASFGEGLTRLHVVTHSMGGLVARALIARHRPFHLGRVVMLGPPNGGSEVADALHRLRPYRWFFGPAGAQLVTVRDPGLVALLGTVDFPLGVIAGRRSLDPLSSLLWLRAPNDGRVTVARTRVAGMADHRVLPVTHPLMMRDARVQAETLHFLATGRFAPVGANG